jgi:hypothetical protein
VNDRTYLGAALQTLYHLLNSTSAVHVLRDAHKVVCHALDEEQALLLLAMFKELLAQVVAKRICFETLTG